MERKNCRLMDRNKVKKQKNDNSRYPKYELLPLSFFIS